jgi:hypothetical protein
MSLKIISNILAIRNKVFNFARKRIYAKIEDMDKKDLRNRIEYVICCVGAFASRFKLSNAQSYAYLRRFGAVDFLISCYEAEHTLSIEDAVEDMQAICLQKGGRIA